MHHNSFLLSMGGPAARHHVVCSALGKGVGEGTGALRSPSASNSGNLALHELLEFKFRRHLGGRSGCTVAS